MPIRGLERFAPSRETPSDFDALWETTLTELGRVAPRPRARADRPPTAGTRLERVGFDSLGGASISGYLLRSTAAGPRPLLVHAHGYNARYEVMTDWARRGLDVFGFDARGFGRSRAAHVPDPEGYVVTGVSSPYRSILRGAVADYLQAVATARLLVGREPARVVYYGFSFGGALALMAGALSRAADLVVLGQPTFGWTPERLRLAVAGSATELKRYVERYPWRAAAAQRTFAYFDTLNFAPRLTAPTLLGVGLDDDVVPSRTVLAVANHMACPLELRLLPVSHSDDPRESLWGAFEREWLEHATGGVPADFGASARQLESIVPAAAASRPMSA